MSLPAQHSVCSHIRVPEHSDLATHHITAIPGQLVAVAVAGELDMSNAVRLQQWITDAAKRHPAVTIEVDLSGVGFIDSTIIRTLVATRQQLATDGRTFRVRGATGPVAQVLRTTGVLAILTGNHDGGGR